MSVKQRIIDLTSATATPLAQQLIEIQIRQLQMSLSPMASVSAIKGDQVTLNMPNGSQKTVTNTGGRIVGVGDAMITDGNYIAV